MTVVKLYKFQALVTLHPANDGGPCPKLGVRRRSRGSTRVERRRGSNHLYRNTI